MSDAINVGDVLKDNDPRMEWRSTLRVVEVSGDHVYATDRCGTRLRYKRSRIHTDGKARKAGLSRVYESTNREAANGTGSES